MAIGTNDVIDKFGTQDSIHTGTPGTIADDAFSVVGDITVWTNTDDAPFGKFVLKCQFDTTMPTVGSIDLFARPTNIDGTDEANAPDTDYEQIYLGTFPIDFGVAADADFFTVIKQAILPNFKTQQTYEFYLRNKATSQVIGTDWTLKITPFTRGPVAA